MMTAKKGATGVLVLALLLTACATPQPRWTPETVAPPASPPAGVEPAPFLEQRAQPLPSTTTPSEGNPIKLTRDGALLTALVNNRTIEVARFGPKIGATYVPEARAAFDPMLTSSVSTGHDTRQSGASSISGISGAGSVQSVQSGAQSQTPLDTPIQVLTQLQRLALILEQPKHPYTETENTNGSITIQENLPTGTQVFLTGAGSVTDTNLSRHDYQGNWTFGVTQALLRGAGTAVNLVALRQAKNRATESDHAFRASVLGVTEQVEIAYWNLVLAVELLKIRQFAVTLADEQLRRNEELLAVGKAIEGDVMASRAEKASRTADLTDAQADLRTQTATMIRLLNPAGDNPWQLTLDPTDPAEVVQVPVDATTSEQLALKYRPELAQARLELANLDLSVTQAKNGLLPSLAVVGSYGRTSRGASSSGVTKFLNDSEFENYRIGLEFQTPILNRAEKARYRRAVLAQTQGERSVADLEQSIATQVRQAAIEVEKEWAHIHASQEALQSRTEQLRIAQGRYNVGKTTNLDLLLVQRDLIQTQIDDAAARVKYIQALSALYAAEGTLLDRRGISLDAHKES
jgi:outer membrane protein TolC